MELKIKNNKRPVTYSKRWRLKGGLLGDLLQTWIRLTGAFTFVIIRGEIRKFALYNCAKLMPLASFDWHIVALWQVEDSAKCVHKSVDHKFDYFLNLYPIA